MKENGIIKGNRRNFIKKATLTALTSALGMDMIYGSFMPKGLIPLELISDDRLGSILNKHPELSILNDKPWNVETPAHLLDDKVTPSEKMFVRNNGVMPENPNPDSWTLVIEGESAEKRLEISLSDLKTKFKKFTYQLTVECGGNGRSEFNPPAKGNQWTTGAVSCGNWSGARLKDVLNLAGIKSNAVYIGYYGADTHLSGNKSKVTISRGVPISKALENESLLAYELNGEDIPLANGYPLRLVFGGWPASTSGKWLKRIVIRDKIHDGAKMTGQSYRVPCDPVAPGTKVEDEDMCIIESMPIKSLITYPKSGAILRPNQILKIRGHAWAGDHEVTNLETSIDFGQSWQMAILEKPANRLAWQHFNAEIKFSKKGYYEVWARASSSNGNQQPMIVPGWNPKGYLNNACHRIAIKVK